MIFTVIDLVQAQFDIVSDLIRLAVARSPFPWLLSPETAWVLY
jgi:hypothetical protein